MPSKYLKKIAKYLYWNIYGLMIRNRNISIQIKSILFVCKGNICRSPFAEQIVLKYIVNSSRYECCSAGILVEEPKPSPPEAIISAKSFGIDLEDHRSRQVDYSMMEKFDMVIVMEAWQYDFLRKLFMEFRKKIFLLPLFDNNHRTINDKYLKLNIIDPYGKSPLEYKECFNRMERCISMLLGNIHWTTVNQK